MSVIVLVAALHSVNARSGGAPLQACDNLMPQHSGNPSQTTPSPHIVNLTGFDSMFNETLNTTFYYYTPDTLYPGMAGYEH